MASDGSGEQVLRTEEAYRALIARLNDVYAAHVQLAEDGSISEIHVLAGKKRNPKQLMRDISSALASMYQVQIDHRVVSIAQLKDDPAAPAEQDAPVRTPRERLQFKSLTQGMRGGRFHAAVTLSLAGAAFTGEASCSNTPFQRSRAVACATLAAANRFLDAAEGETPGEALHLVAIQQTTVSVTRVVIVVLECLAGQGAATLVGAAEWTDDEQTAIVRATLDALNRKISVLMEA